MFLYFSRLLLDVATNSSLQIQWNNYNLLGNNDWAPSIQLVLLMTLLMLGPSIVMLTTSFTRIVIVLSFVRNALGLGSNPSNPIIIGLAFFLSIFLMAPVGERIYETAIEPYNLHKITSKQAVEIGGRHLKLFMLGQTRPKDLEFFLDLSRLEKFPILMAMGMMMMPPAILALPFKILLFVLVDGWSLVVKTLVKSFF